VHPTLIEIDRTTHHPRRMNRAGVRSQRAVRRSSTAFWGPAGLIALQAVASARMRVWTTSPCVRSLQS